MTLTEMVAEALHFFCETNYGQYTIHEGTGHEVSFAVYHFRQTQIDPSLCMDLIHQLARRKRDAKKHSLKFEPLKTSIWIVKSS